MNTSIPVMLTGPATNSTQSYPSIRAAARALSGTGRASGGLRKRIRDAAFEGRAVLGTNVVRRNAVSTPV
jgi:hypothetical protein